MLQPMPSTAGAGSAPSAATRVAQTAAQAGRHPQVRRADGKVRNAALKRYTHLGARAIELWNIVDQLFQGAGLGFGNIRGFDV